MVNEAQLPLFLLIEGFFRVGEEVATHGGAVAGRIMGDILMIGFLWGLVMAMVLGMLATAVCCCCCCFWACT